MDEETLPLDIKAIIDMTIEQAESQSLTKKLVIAPTAYIDKLYKYKDKVEEYLYTLGVEFRTNELDPKADNGWDIPLTRKDGGSLDDFYLEKPQGKGHSVRGEVTANNYRLWLLF